MTTLRIALIAIGSLAFVAAGTWALRSSGSSWSDLDNASGFLVNVTIMAGAVAAIVKFQLYNLLGHRWRSDLECLHHDLADGTVLFMADYTLTNTGQRPLRFSKVQIRMVRTKKDGVLVTADEESVVAERTMQPSETNLKGLFHLEPGERSIFTLRCHLPELDPAVFVICGFELPHRRVPAAFFSFYVKDVKKQLPSVKTKADPKGEANGA